MNVTHDQIALIRLLLNFIPEIKIICFEWSTLYIGNRHNWRAILNFIELAAVTYIGHHQLALCKLNTVLNRLWAKRSK
ncbi:hypothetical protein D3C74_386500 [compost metagenome]